MPQGTPMINGRLYGWADLVIVIMGVVVSGVTAVSWKRKRVKENRYGAGAQPVGRGYGNIEYEASITLHVDEIAAIEAAIPSGHLDDALPFNIVISYQPETGPIKTETLKFAEFTENARDWKQGDTASEVELPLIIGKVITK
jgi:hypothetical protein